MTISIVADEVKTNGKSRLEFTEVSSKKVKKKTAEKLKLVKEGKKWTRGMPKDPEKMLKVARKFVKAGYQLIVNPLVTLEPKPTTDKAVVKKAKALKALIAEHEAEVKEKQTKLAATREELEALVRQHGTYTKPGTEDSILIVDTDKWQYTFAKGSMKKQDKVIIAWAEKKENKKVAKALVVKKPVVDTKVFGNLKKANRIPVADLETMEIEADPVYRFNYWDLAGSKCPECDAKLSKKAKFCKECGAKLG